MFIAIVCPACAVRLRVREQMLGKQVKCPTCHRPFLARATAETSQEPERDELVQERPPLARRPVKEEAVMVSSRPDTLPPPLTEVDEPAALSNPQDDDLPEFELEEVADDAGPSGAQSPKKKKKKKKKIDRRPLEERAQRTELPAWVWWTFGGGGVALTMFILLSLAMLCSPENRLKGWAGYLLIATPISTVIFFVALYLSSVWFGALEMGELHVCLFKAFFLVFIVDMVSLIPGGFILTFVVWLAGLFTLFRLELWEAHVVIFLNYGLNFLLKMLLFHAYMHWAEHGADDFDHDPQFGNPPARVKQLDVLPNDD